MKNIAPKYYTISLAVLLFFSGIVSADNSPQQYISKNITQKLVAQNPIQSLQKIHIVLTKWGYEPAEKILVKWQTFVSDPKILDNINFNDKSWMEYYQNFLWALIYFQKKEYRQAAKYFNQAEKKITNNKKIVYPLELLANFYYHLGMNQHALKQYQSAIRSLRQSLLYGQLVSSESFKYQIFYTLLEMIAVYDNLLSSVPGAKKATYALKAIEINSLLLELEKKYKVIEDDQELLHIHQKILQLVGILREERKSYSASKQKQYIVNYYQLALKSKNISFQENALQQYYKWAIAQKKTHSFFLFLQKLNTDQMQEESRFVVLKYRAMISFASGKYALAKHIGQKIQNEFASLFNQDQTLKYHHAIALLFNQQFKAARDILSKMILKQQNPQAKQKNEGIYADTSLSSLFFLKAMTCYLQQDFSCTQKILQKTLKKILQENAASPPNTKENKQAQKKTEPVLHIRTLLYLAIVHKIDKNHKQAQDFVHQAIKISRQNNLWQLRVWSYIVDYYFALQDRNYKKINFYFYRLPGYAKKEKIFKQYEWLFIWAKFVRYNKINEKDFASLLASIERYNMHEQWKTTVEVYVPNVLIEDMLTSVFDFYYKENKHLDLITATEFFRELRNQTVSQKQKFLLQKINPFFMYHALSNLLNFYNDQYKDYAKLNYQTRKRIQSESLVRKKKYFSEIDLAKQDLLLTSFQKIQKKIVQSFELLPSNHVILYYPVIGNKYYPIYIFKDGPQGMRDVAGIYESLGVDVQNYIKTLQNFNLKNYQETGNNLFKKLFARDIDFLLEKKISTIGIIGGRQLGSIPFAALVTNDQKFMVEKFSFFNLFQISDIGRLFSSSKNINAIQKLNKEKKMTALFQPELNDTMQDYDFTSTEVDLIKSRFDQIIMINKSDLNKKNIFQALNHSDIWHISLPVVWYKKEHQNNAFFILAVDGRRLTKITLDQLLLLKNTNIEFVFLSHVNWNFESSNYDIEDKKIYLHQIARAVGIKTYIHSLIQGNKDSFRNSATLISAFYIHLLKNKKPAHQALVEAQIRVKQRNAHPYFWANYLLTY